MNFPKTPGQCKYMRVLQSHKPIIIATGPAGTGKTNIASRVMENREGLLKRWLSQTSETNGEKIGLKMHKKNMDISRKMLMKSLEITPETSKSFDEV